MIRRFNISSIALLMLFLASCARYASNKDGFIDLPPTIIEKAEKIIIDKVGEEFFQLNFTYLPDKSRVVEQRSYRSKHNNEIRILNRAGYRLEWEFEVFCKPYIHRNIAILLDTEGKCQRNCDLQGVPDCMEDPKNCEFSMTREHAIGLAKKAGLDKGNEPWRSYVDWRHEEEEGYFWVITMYDGQYSRDAYVNMITGSVELSLYWTLSY